MRNHIKEYIYLSRLLRDEHNQKIRNLVVNRSDKIPPKNSDSYLI